MLWTLPSKNIINSVDFKQIFALGFKYHFCISSDYGYLCLTELNSSVVSQVFLMEDIRFTETEQRYFGDLFLLCCDTENTGKVSLLKATELFRTSKIPSEVIKEITEVCSEGKSSFLGRKQFYVALKLIAATQSGISIHSPDLVNSISDLPLPKFLWSNYEIKENNSNSNPDSPDLIQLADSNAKNFPSIDRLNSSEGELDDVFEKKNKSPKSGRLSVEASSTASDSPTPTNSVQEKRWATSENWLGLVSEEQRQLLGTEEESSDKHSSEDEGDKEFMIITNEQREYYSNQFRSLQPDPTGLLAGSTARLFFEKSKLPVHELRKIWQLSDVTKDGALSLEEFNVAMHLVVLRRNNIPLPDTLPPSLIPTTISVNSVVQPPVPPPREENSPEQSSVSAEPYGNKQWTKFVDSPTSSISSPGPKPVNFDFHKAAVEQDPKIYHPVPVRVTPDSNFVNSETDCCRSPRKLDYENINNDGTYFSSKKNVVSNVNQDSQDIRPIQRPQPRKPPPGPGAIPPPPQQLIEDGMSGPTSLPVCMSTPMAPKKEPPPPPPPRPYRTHTRSSSLDLNKLGKSSILSAPPAVPPRTSPSSTSPKKLIGQRSEDDVISIAAQNTAFADFSQFHSSGDREINNGVEEVEEPPRKHGAFQIYRKQAKIDSPSCPGLRLSDGKMLEEHNTVLTRMCFELSQELVKIQEERNALQIKLEQLQAKCNS